MKLGAIAVCANRRYSGTMARILILDDNAEIGKLLLRYLGSRHAVTVMTHGREAVESLRAGARFDTIFSDVTMPQMGGLEFHTQVSEIDLDQARRIVFLTGGGDTPGLPNRSVAKPFEITELRAIIDEMGSAGEGDHLSTLSSG
jgi:CheY-like chemotaxis protein